MNSANIRKSLFKQFEQSRNIVITTHMAPDADALGSSLGLSTTLEKLGHTVDVIVPDAYPAFLKWMNGSDRIHLFDKKPSKSETIISKADIVFALDFNRLDRIGKVGPLIGVSKAFKILIDHHLDPSHEFDFTISHVSASSTSELVFDFIQAMKWENTFTISSLECLYAGIMTDTGSFRFSSTSAHTHNIVASMMQAGLKPDHVHQLVYDQYSFDRLRLIGYALSEKFEFDKKTGISIIWLSELEKRNHNYQRGDTEGLVNYGLSVAGSKVAVFMSEENGMVKFSFRSKGDADVNVFARKYFNGGGHKNAAGGRLDTTLDKAHKLLSKALKEHTF